jgi:hypothetical protein
MERRVEFEFLRFGFDFENWRLTNSESTRSIQYIIESMNEE